MTDIRKRLLPKLNDDNRFFWQGGKDGKLRLLRCDQCRHYVHPPAPVCSRCLSEELSVELVSGKGKVYSFTVNHHVWNAAVDVPYVIAIVELDEQKGLRLTSNVVNASVGDVQIGMSVRVAFESHDGGKFVPVFETE